MGSIGLKHLLEKSSPYEKYRTSLVEAELMYTALGKDWISVGEMSLQNAAEISLPYQEILYFIPEQPHAYSFRYPVQEG